MLTVPAGTVEHCYTTMGFLGDAVGNLVVFFGEDEELHGLSCAVYDVVQYKTYDKQGYKTEYHPSPVVEDEIAGTDDDNVASHNHASQRHVLVFVDNGGNDVRASRTSVVVEYYSQSCTAHGRTYQASHEVLPFAQKLVAQQKNTWIQNGYKNSGTFKQWSTIQQLKTMNL